MSFIIRSANGQRSLKKINSNKTEDRKPLRDELIEALRGLVIKFEVRIADIIQQDDEPASEKQQAPAKGPSADPEPIPRAQPAQAAQPEPAAQSTEPVRQAQPEAAVRPASNGMSNGDDIVEKPMTNGFTLESEKPKQKATDFVPASLLRPKTTPSIVPVIKKEEAPAATAATRAPLIEANLAPQTSSSPAIVNPPILTAQVPAAAKPSELAKSLERVRISESVKFSEPVKSPEPVKAPEPAKPKLQPKETELVKGVLKMGSVIETVIVGFGGTTEEPVYYVPYDTEKFVQLGQLIQDQGPAIEAQPQVNSIDVGDIVFAKSKEDNVWYRSIVRKVNSDDVDVFFFDWGLEETLELARIRRLYILELGLSSSPACAVKVDILNKPGSLVERFIDQGERMSVQVDSYDETTDTYSINIQDGQ